MSSYKFSKTSLKNLEGVHPSLVKFCYSLLEIIDIKIVSGVRTDTTQIKLFKDGASEIDGINKKSKHQIQKDGFGHAVDILPIPKNINMYESTEENKIRWAQFDGICFATAYHNKILIRTGFKWRSSAMSSLRRQLKYNTLIDGNHIELI